jgi:hypothetical protein
VYLWFVVLFFDVSLLDCYLCAGLLHISAANRLPSAGLGIHLFVGINMRTCGFWARSHSVELNDSIRISQGLPVKWG